MNLTRRGWLAAGVTLGGCSLLPAQPAAERREWPLEVRRPDIAPPRLRGPVLLVRTVQAGPGLTQRGLQWRRHDGSLQVDFYEQWAVPPPQGIEASLRHWLAGAGMFSAVIGPGSRMPAGFALESELTLLQIDEAAGVARAALAVVVLDERGGGPRVAAQDTLRAEAPLTGSGVQAAVQASLAAVADMLRQLEALLRRLMVRS